MGLFGVRPPQPEPQPEKEPEPKPKRDPEEKLNELQQIMLWRLTVLMDAGFPLEIAEQFARRPDIDLHEACRLMSEGCPPVTAARILL